MARKSTHGLKFFKFQDDSGKWHRVPEGTDIEDYKKSLSPAKYPFSLQLADEIVALYMSGKSVIEIAKLKNLSEHVIYYWMTSRPDFKLKMKSARELRGFVYEEKAIDAAEQADEDTVHAQRLKADTYKWAAGVNNPEVHGTKTKIVGDANAPLQIVVNTGIIREQDKPIEVPCEVAQ